METQNLFYLLANEKNIIIRQYLSLNNFITQLTRNEYFVRRKNLFEDVNEKTLPIRLLFHPMEVSPNNEANCSEKREKIIDAQSKKIEKYKELSNCFVSCWTKNETDNYFMWETYAYKYGVCVVSTIFNFISSFKSDEFLKYDTYCAPVSYRQPAFSDAPEDLLFVKMPLYSVESEIRFLFVPNFKETTHKSNIWLPYDYKVMIDYVILSPFWSSQAALFLKTSLEDKYGINVRISK